MRDICVSNREEQFREDFGLASYLALEVGCIELSTFESLQSQVTELGRILAGLKASLAGQRDSTPGTRNWAPGPRNS